VAEPEEPAQTLQEALEQDAQAEPQERKKREDPAGTKTINLSNDPDGPKMRLLRRDRRRKMFISFSEKPAEEIIQALRDDGWKWERDDSAWTKPLDPQAKWATHAEAEKLFHDLANVILQENGIAPVSNSMAASR
jgi:hypothetical protein